MARRPAPASLVALLALASTPGPAQTRKVEVVHAPAFLVRVAVDRPDRVYREGDELAATVASERDGYLYLFNLTPDGRVNCLFPNKHQPDNRIVAGQPVRVPAADAPFAFPVQGPRFGAEWLRAVVTRDPLPDLLPDAAGKALFAPDALTKGIATRLDADQFGKALKDVGVTGRPAADPAAERRQARVAEHEVEIRTVAKDAPQPAARPRRVGVFVGVGKYADPKVPALPAAADAKAMHALMTTRGKLDEATLLTDEKATLAAVREVFEAKLPAATRPGDEVFVYWAGHGGRVADPTGAEPDGLSEFLVPHDGKVSDPRGTMLLDLTFGRWVQGLDGRRVVVILDACHSGGQAAGAKLRAAGLGGPVPKARGRLTGFFENGARRTKDIGQKEVAVLASSKPDEESWFGDDGGVMTHFLLERLRAGDRVTLSDAFKAVSGAVPGYVRRELPGVSQTPVLIDHTTPPVYLVP